MYRYTDIQMNIYEPSLESSASAYIPSDCITLQNTATLQLTGTAIHCHILSHTHDTGLYQYPPTCLP